MQNILTPSNFDQLIESIRALHAAIQRPRPETPEAMNADQAADFCCISTSMWRSLVARGLCPRPINLGDGRCPRWTKTEIRAWLLAGSPHRGEWVKIRDAKMREAAHWAT